MAASGLPFDDIRDLIAAMPGPDMEAANAVRAANAEFARWQKQDADATAREVTKIEIKPEAVDPDDVEMLEDLVLAAVNEALRQYEAASDATVSKITGGMKLGF